MHEYTPNSHRYREEQQKAKSTEKKINKVVSGTVRTKKKSEISKFADIFIAEDVNTVKNFIINDVVIPTIRDTVWSIFTNSLDMFLYGGTGRGDRRSGGSKVSYRKFYDDRRDDRRSSDAPRTRTRFDFEDIVFESRGDAERVREEMNNVIDEYGVVTVADMYDMADRSQPYTSNRYGWTSIRSAEAVRLRDGGYILKLPRPMAID